MTGDWRQRLSTRVRSGSSVSFLLDAISPIRSPVSLQLSLFTGFPSYLSGFRYPASGFQKAARFCQGSRFVCSVTSSSPSSNKAPRDVVVRDVPIELCQLLKFSGLTASGGEAKQVIAERRVRVNGVLETQKRKKLSEGDRVEFGDHTLIVRLNRAHG